MPSAGHADQSFSQYPGFAEYFAAHPRSPELPGAAAQQMLARCRPRLWVGPDQEGPLSFYDDYIAHGRLQAGDGRLISRSVTRSQLNAQRDDPRAEFVHEPAPGPVTPVAFGRVDREAVLDLGDFTFLTWHFVFRRSGLAAHLGWWRSLLAGLAGDLDDWHTLDHYTAATLALDPLGVPVALILQQHNGLRAYWLGSDLAWPADARLRLCAALRSNELYPCPDGGGRHRVVPFMTAETLAYLITGEQAPWRAAEDVTEPAREIAYRLDFLPPADAFYSFAGYLGERRRLPGREGPPGADYFAPPALLSRSIHLVALRWRENDTERMPDMIAFLGDGSEAAWARLVRRFRTQLRSRAAPRSACAE